MRSASTSSPKKSPRRSPKKSPKKNHSTFKICSYFTGCNCNGNHSDHPSPSTRKKVPLDLAGLIKFFRIRDCVISLTKLENMKDDYVLRWLKDRHTLQSSEESERSSGEDELTEPMEVDFPASVETPESDKEKENHVPSRKESNDTVALPQNSDITSDDSSPIMSLGSNRSSHRKKRKVARISISDSDHSSEETSVTSSRLRSSRNEAYVARKRICYVYQDEHEDEAEEKETTNTEDEEIVDKEVEEFSGKKFVRRSTRNRSQSTYNYLDYDSEDDSPTPPRCRSQGPADYSEQPRLTEANIKAAQLTESVAKPMASCLRSTSSRDSRHKSKRSVSFSSVMDTHPEARKLLGELRVQLVRLESILNWSLPQSFSASDIEKLADDYVQLYVKSFTVNYHRPVEETDEPTDQEKKQNSQEKTTVNEEMEGEEVVVDEEVVDEEVVGEEEEDDEEDAVDDVEGAPALELVSTCSPEITEEQEVEERREPPNDVLVSGSNELLAEAPTHVTDGKDDSAGRTCSQCSMVLDSQELLNR